MERKINLQKNDFWMRKTSNFEFKKKCLICFHQPKDSHEASKTSVENLVVFSSFLLSDSEKKRNTREFLFSCFSLFPFCVALLRPIIFRSLFWWCFLFQELMFQNMFHCVLWRFVFEKSRTVMEVVFLLFHFEHCVHSVEHLSQFGMNSEHISHFVVWNDMCFFFAFCSCCWWWTRFTVFQWCFTCCVAHLLWNKHVHLLFPSTKNPLLHCVHSCVVVEHSLQFAIVVLQAVCEFFF